MKQIIHMNHLEFEGMGSTDIDHWYAEQGRFCSRCAEGKLKEHSRVKSTKPLHSNAPGAITVGDIMFVELKDNSKNH
jgi:hypothetical protein